MGTSCTIYPSTSYHNPIVYLKLDPCTCTDFQCPKHLLHATHSVIVYIVCRTVMIVNVNYCVSSLQAQLGNSTTAGELI